MKTPDLLQLLFAAALIGTLTSYLAKNRGRDPVKWFFIGMLCGIFGLIALFLFPAIKTNEEQKVKLQEIEPPPAPVSDALATKPWYYLDAAHATLGPCPLDKLQELYKDGTITMKSYVWCEGMLDWKRISDLPELQSRFY